MIAPDPALTGPRPAATPRDAGRTQAAKGQRGGDFDSVLNEHTDVAERAAAERPEAAPREVADAPVAEGDAAMVVAAVLPAAPAPAGGPDVAAAMVPAEPAALALRAETAIVQPEAAADPVGDPGPFAEAPLAGAPRADARVAARPVPPAAAPAGGAVPAVAAPAAAEVPTRRGRSERTDLPEVATEQEPGRAVAPAPREAAPIAAAATPVEGAGGQAVTLRDGAAPGWHLVVDSGNGAARAEALAPHALAPVQAQVAQAQAVVGQVAVAVGRASDDKVEIRLDPPELGRVQIHLTRTDGGVQALVLADRPETQDLLRRHAEELARELGQAGYDTVSLEFAGGEARSGREERAMDWIEAAPPPAVEASVPAVGPRRSVAGGLDVRL